MDVTVTQFRADLAAWVARARSGEEVVLTERGTPVARLVGTHGSTRLDDLVRQGLVGAAPPGARPVARGAARAVATGPVAELVGDERR